MQAVRKNPYRPLPIEIATSRVEIRLPRQKDVPAIIDYYERNREHLEPFEPVKPTEFYQPTFWDGCVMAIQREFPAAQSVRTFLFDRRDSTTVVGYIGLNQIVRLASWQGVIGYSLDKDWQGRGVMHEALAAHIAWDFDNLNLHRICANYMPHNRRSGELLRRLGFVVEGYARDYLLINGQWEDHVLTAVTNPDWKHPNA